MSDSELLLKSVAEMLEKIDSTLEKLNATPNVAVPMQSIEEQSVPAPSRFVDPATRLMLREELSTKSSATLNALFMEQARKKDMGIPLDLWLNTAGYAAQNVFNNIHGQLDPEVSKLLDVAGSTPLIRQDLEPVLYEVFVRMFPYYAQINKEPANGLVHAFNRQLTFGGAEFMPELGTVTDDKSTFERATTNIAILATRRGISLKSGFAIQAGGMPYNTEMIEMQGGLRAIAFKMQKTIFEGQAADSGGTASNELGLYDANGFTGYRSIFNTVRAKNIDPATNPTTTGNVRRTVDAAILEIIQTGGNPGAIWSAPHEKITFDEQQDANVRIMEASQRNASVGVVTNAVNTIAGPLPWNIVPGTSITSYTSTEYSSNTVRDVYIVDDQSVSLPYLGTDGPTVLEIPVGISGQLTKLFIIFLMNGLAVKVPQWSNKIRVKV